jgi:hypothetical protein
MPFTGLFSVFLAKRHLGSEVLNYFCRVRIGGTPGRMSFPTKYYRSSDTFMYASSFCYTIFRLTFR